MPPKGIVLGRPASAMGASKRPARNEEEKKEERANEKVGTLLWPACGSSWERERIEE